MQLGRLYVKRGCNEERESNVERGSEFEANFERVFERECACVCVCIRSNFVVVKEREREREIQCKENRERKDNTSGW